ncbi:MAG: radical SAM protein [Treponema sp.]|nr:radical SAM protein [Treponema sp.]
MEYDDIKNWFVENKKLFFASIELTQRCNFSCKHCFCPEKTGGGLSLSELKKIIDKIYSTGCLFLNITGGEVLLCEHFLELYLYAKEKGFIIDIMTNGSLLRKEHVEVFKKFPPSNISITLYGANEQEYKDFTGNEKSFAKVMEGLELLKKNNIQFALRAVAAKTFEKSLLDGSFDKIAENFSVPFRYDPIIFPKISRDMSPLYECMSAASIVELEKSTGLRKSAWENKIKEAETEKCFLWHCHGGVSSIFVDCKGNAFVCGIYRNEPISLVENEIDDVLMHLRNIHQKHEKIIYSNECSRCDKRKICKWCPAYSFLYNGNECDVVDFFCDLEALMEKCFGEIVL